MDNLFCFQKFRKRLRPIYSTFQGFQGKNILLNVNFFSSASKTIEMRLVASKLIYLQGFGDVNVFFLTFFYHTFEFYQK